MVTAVLFSKWDMINLAEGNDLERSQRTKVFWRFIKCSQYLFVIISSCFDIENTNNIGLLELSSRNDSSVVCRFHKNGVLLEQKISSSIFEKLHITFRAITRRTSDRWLWLTSYGGMIIIIMPKTFHNNILFYLHRMANIKQRLLRAEHTNYNMRDFIARVPQRQLYMWIYTTLVSGIATF